MNKFNTWAFFGAAVTAFTPSDNIEYFLGPTLEGDTTTIACGGFVDWQTEGVGEDATLKKYMNVSALVQVETFVDDVYEENEDNTLEVSLCYPEDDHHECMLWTW